MIAMWPAYQNQQSLCTTLFWPVVNPAGHYAEYAKLGNQNFRCSLDIHLGLPATLSAIATLCRYDLPCSTSSVIFLPMFAGPLMSGMKDCSFAELKYFMERWIIPSVLSLAIWRGLAFCSYFAIVRANTLYRLFVLWRENGVWLQYEHNEKV